MVNGALLDSLKEKLKTKNSEKQEYDRQRKKIVRMLNYIFFDQLPPMFNNDTYYCGEELKQLGFTDKDGGITLWIDTTKENRQDNDNNLLECITFDHYGHRGELDHLNNEQLQMFLDNIDIVLNKLVKTIK